MGLVVLIPLTYNLRHGDAHFSAVYGFMKDPIVASGLYEHQEV